MLALVREVRSVELIRLAAQVDEPVDGMRERPSLHVAVPGSSNERALDLLDTRWVQSFSTGTASTG